MNENAFGLPLMDFVERRNLTPNNYAPYLPWLHPRSM
jgi:hypothetical protein